MERRYLVAALAIIATFAGVSHGFRSLKEISRSGVGRWHTMARTGCDANPARQAMAKIRTRLRPDYPEEAQLLAEMNVPFTTMQSKLAQEMAKQDIASQCARARAAREAQRETMKAQEKAMRISMDGSLDPISFEVNIPNDLERRIEQQTTAVAARMTAQNLKLQLAADKLQAASMRMAAFDAPNVDLSGIADKVSTQVVSHIRCKVNSR